MRRILPLFLMVGVAGLLIPVLVVKAQLPSTTSAPACCSPATCIGSNPSPSSSTDAKIIDEMIAILKETKSEETFVVTAMALGRMGPEAKRALPQLIRNAERLELFEDLFDANAEAGDRQVVRQVAEAIMMLAESNKDGRPIAYGNPAPPMTYANGPYGPPSAFGSWNQPVVVPSVVPPCPTPGAPCPVASGPVAPTGLTPVDVPTPAASAPTPLPAAKKASRKDGKSRTPVAPPPPPTR